MITPTALPVSYEQAIEVRIAAQPAIDFATVRFATIEEAAPLVRVVGNVQDSPRERLARTMDDLRARGLSPTSADDIDAI
jgi:hypothetical protein